MLKVFNTLTRQKEAFTPITPGEVKLYVCGVTIYDYCHIGHARTYVAFDVVVRYLRERGYKVNYVRNITDVDDKIIRRAAENNEAIDAVTKRFTQAMHDDFDALNLLGSNSGSGIFSLIPRNSSSGVMKFTPIFNANLLGNKRKKNNLEFQKEYFLVFWSHQKGKNKKKK